MFERFTQEINNVLDLAYDETQRLGHKETATVQLLLGLIRQEKGLAAQVLTDTGVSLENARLEVEKIQGRGAGSRKDIPYNQHTMEVFDFSVEEADQLKDSEIDTEHLLLGLLRQTQGGAVRVLQILGVEPNELRNQVLRKLAEQGHPTASQFLPSSPPANSNGTDSNKVHLALIQKILENTQGSEAEVVRNNPDLIDPELIERVASILEQQKNSQGAELLRGLITPRHQQKTKATANLTENSVTVSQPIEISSFLEVSVPVPEPVQLPDPPNDIEPIIEVPVPTNQEMEKFICQLLRVTFESKGNEEVVHNFFRENLHLLNDKLPDVLRNWWLSKFTSLDQDKKLELAHRILAISSLIRKFEGGSRANNLEIALTGYQIIAPVFTEAEYPEQWAITQNFLGLTYLERVQGNRLENLKQAIACFTAALCFYSQEQFPKQRKVILGSLKKATTEIGNLSGKQETLEMMPQNSERIQAYLDLIEQFLRTHHNLHQTILDDNSELLDAGLIEIMRGRGEAEKNRGNIQDGELLIAIAEKINETLPIPPVSVELSLIETEICSEDQPDVKSLQGVENSEVKIDTAAEFLPNIEHQTKTVTPELLEPIPPKNQIDLILELLKGSEQFTDLLLNFIFTIMIGGPEQFNSDLAKQAEKQAIILANQGQVNEAMLLQHLSAEILQGIELDDNFIQSSSDLKKAAADFEKMGVKNVPQLMTKITKLGFAEANKNPELRDNILSYGVFMQELSETLFKGEAEPKIVYPLLENNLDKLNDNFITLWRIFVTAMILEVDSNYAENLAGANIIFGNLMTDFTKGDKSTNLEIAITTFEIANLVLKPDQYPEYSAELQTSLGLAYFDRERGEKAKNYETAIEYWQQGLKICEQQKDLQELRGKINFYLGLAYLERIEGNKPENYQLAIDYFKSSLTIFTRQDFPEQWAEINLRLGIVYGDSVMKKITGNIKTAIQYFQSVLKVYNPKTSPEEWALTLYHLGMAYLDLNQGKTDNEEKAIYFFNKTLQVYNPESYPQEWAGVQGSLGVAYMHHFKGVKADNFELAIKHLKNALDKLSRDAYPKNWAEINGNLGKAYVERIQGGKAENIELAINHALVALDIFTPSEFPEDMARIKNILGSAYSDRIRGDISENLEQAIKHSSDALEVCSSRNDLENMAMIQHNLSSFYIQRIEGNESDNIETAIEYCLAALKVRTREKFPQQWANTQHNLGKAYGSRIEGNPSDNFAAEIESYLSALEIFQLERFPEQWAMIYQSMGMAYFNNISTGKTAEEVKENLDHSIDCLKNALKVYKPEYFPHQYAKIKALLGKAYQISGETQESYTAFTESIDRLQLIRGEIIKGSGLETDKQKLAEEWHFIYQDLVEVCLAENKLEEAIQYVELSKARNLVELFADRNILPKGNFPEETITELTKIRREIVNERIFESNKSKGVVSEIMLNRDSEHLSYTPVYQGNRLNSLQQELEELIREKIAPIDPNFVFTQKVQPISFLEIQKLIPDEKTVIMEFYITNDAIHTFLISKQSDKPIYVPSTLEKVRNLFDFCFNRYFRNYSEQNEVWKQEFFMRLKQLAGIVGIDKIISEIFSKISPDCDQLIVIPHRFMHLLPIHALPLETGECLLERFSRGIRYAPSCQLLQLSGNPNNQKFEQLFAIQNPDETLSFADLEVKAISSLFPEENIYILAQQKATKAALFERSMQEKLRLADCVHFSCHGTFKLESSWESALTLADSDLTLGEIFALELPRCRLVTLSACETGVTDFNNRSDEYISLPSGFLYAGASNVVASLWTVNDLSTTFLMIKLYENLTQQLKETKELNVSLALRDAQLWLKQVDQTQLEEWLPNVPLTNLNHQAQLEDWLSDIEPNTQPFQSPYHWAGFCAIGQ